MRYTKQTQEAACSAVRGQYARIVLAYREALENIVMSSSEGPDSTLVRTPDIQAAKKVLKNHGQRPLA